MDTSTIVQTVLQGMFTTALSLWKAWLPLFLLMLIYYLVRVYIIRDTRREKYGKLKSLEDLRKLSGTEFEEFTGVLFTKLGFRATLTGRSHDGGIDLVFEKDGKTHYVQCKKRTNIKVSVGEVRDFYGAISDKMNAKGYFITTQTFTTEAELFAQDKPIELIDQFALLKYIKQADLKTIPESHNICPKCGGNLIERKGKFGKFIGCSNYPSCDYTASTR